MNSDIVKEEIEDADFEEVTEEVVEPSVTKVVDKTVARRVEAARRKQIKKGRVVYPASKIPYRIDHQNGKPNETMIQTIMNFKSLDKEQKMEMIAMFAQNKWRWIERRLLSMVDENDYKTAVHVVDLLRDQIKRDKKYAKSLKRGVA